MGGHRQESAHRLTYTTSNATCQDVDGQVSSTVAQADAEGGGQVPPEDIWAVAAEVYEAIWEPLVRYLMIGLGAPRHVAEELVQETTIALVRSALRTGRIAIVSAWPIWYHQARFQWRMYWRSIARRPVHQVEDEAEFGADAFVDPVEIIALRAFIQRVIDESETAGALARIGAGLATDEEIAKDFAVPLERLRTWRFYLRRRYGVELIDFLPGYQSKQKA